MSQERTENLSIWNRIRQKIGGTNSEEEACSHTHLIQEVTYSTDGCEECLKTGDTWVHLRVCMTCGKVGCCDNSKNKHARKHFQTTGHPIIKSIEPGENWMWCYIDETRVYSS
jgi:uncharacterized UBP type Zn finger protein